MGDATCDIDEGEIAQLAIRAVESRGQLRSKLEHEARAFRGDLAEAGIGHLGNLALGPRPDPGAARWLLIEKAHLAEELALVEVGQHHLVTVFILDHDFDRAVDDVVQDIR